MPKCSAFTPYGMLRYSSKPSTLQRIYESTMMQAGNAYAADVAVAADVYAMGRGGGGGRTGEADRSWKAQKPKRGRGAPPGDLARLRSPAASKPDTEAAPRRP